MDSVLTEVKENDASSSLSSPNTLWARIASLYVLTSTFCLDCTVQGHAEHIRYSLYFLTCTFSLECTVQGHAEHIRNSLYVLRPCISTVYLSRIYTYGFFIANKLSSSSFQGCCYYVHGPDILPRSLLEDS